MRTRMLAVIAMGLFGALLCSGCDQPRTAYVHVGPNWEALNELSEGDGGVTVTVDVDQAAFKIGEQFRFRVTSSAQGRLWAVFVDPDDRTSLLHPLRPGDANEIDAGTVVEIPDPAAGVAIEAVEPPGPSVVAFIVTTGNLDLFDALREGGSVSKALHLVEESGHWGIAKRVVEIVE